MMTSMTQKMLPRRVDGFGNIIVPDYPSVEALMKIGNPENTRHHGHLMDLMQSAYDGKDDVEDMMYAMNDMHGGAWYDDLLDGIKDVGKFLWDNKSDIINVAKAVAPLFGGGMEFDDAYEDVVGGAVTRYAHTLAELKHFTFPALKAYVDKLNKYIKKEKNSMPESEVNYITKLRKLKKTRMAQEKKSPKVWAKSEAIRSEYMKSHRPSLGLFLPRGKSRNSIHISRSEANAINADLNKDNRDVINKAKEVLSNDEYEQLVDEIDSIHSEGGTRMGFNKKVKEALIELDIFAKPKKPVKAPVKAPSRRPSIAPVPVPVEEPPVVVSAPKPARKPTMAGSPKSSIEKDLGKANKAALIAARSALTPAEYTNIFDAVSDAHDQTKNPLSFNKVVKQIILENGLSIGKLSGYKTPRQSKPSLGERTYDYDLNPELSLLLPPIPDDPYEVDERGYGRPKRKTVRKKSTQKPTKKSVRKPTKKSKKSRKVRLI